MKTKVQTIRITRGEGGDSWVFTNGKDEIICDNWSMAQDEIDEFVSRYVPENSGYWKTDFEVTWVDGSVYRGTLELKPLNKDNNNDLVSHIKSNCEFYTGKFCPKHLTKEQYLNYIQDSAFKEVRESSENFLNNYQIGDLVSSYKDLPYGKYNVVNFSDEDMEKTGIRKVIQNNTGKITVYKKDFTNRSAILPNFELLECKDWFVLQALMGMV